MRYGAVAVLLPIDPRFETHDGPSKPRAVGEPPGALPARAAGTGRLPDGAEIVRVGERRIGLESGAGNRPGRRAARRRGGPGLDRPAQRSRPGGPPDRE